MGTHLIYVVGASGSGKDTLMGYARQKLAGDPRVCFFAPSLHHPMRNGWWRKPCGIDPSRILTSRENGKLFAMHWSSHGHRSMGSVSKSTNGWPKASRW